MNNINKNFNFPMTGVNNIKEIWTCQWQVWIISMKFQFANDRYAWLQGNIRLPLTGLNNIKVISTCPWQEKHLFYEWQKMIHQEISYERREAQYQLIFRYEMLIIYLFSVRSIGPGPKPDDNLIKIEILLKLWSFSDYLSCWTVVFH